MPQPVAGGSVAIANIGPRPEVRRAIDLSTRPILMAMIEPAPALVAAGEPVEVSVRITGNLGAYLPGTAVLRYRFGGGAFRTAVLMPVPGTATDFTAEIPPAYCGESPQFFFEAMADDMSLQTAPLNAPIDHFGYQIGEDVTFTILDEDFEAGLPDGWSTTGLWHITDLCGIDAGCGGLQWALFGSDATCNYNFGRVVGRLNTVPLIFPPLEQNARHRLTVCHWLQRENNGSFERADLMFGNVVMGRFKDTGSGWGTQTLPLDFLQDISGTLSFLFDSVNESNNAFKGWLIDRVTLTRTITECIQPRPCPANIAGEDSQVGVIDLLAVLAAWGTDAPDADIGPDPGGNGIVDHWDLLAVLAGWGPCDAP
jgi:hypothetical protein